jgi:hypothetical protein
MLIGLLFADADGQAMLEELQGVDEGPPGQDEDDPAADPMTPGARWI